MLASAMCISRYAELASCPVMLRERRWLVAGIWRKGSTMANEGAKENCTAAGPAMCRCSSWVQPCSSVPSTSWKCGRSSAACCSHDRRMRFQLDVCQLATKSGQKNPHNYPAVSQTPHRGEADGDFVGVGECSQRPLQDICTCGLIREQLPADVLQALTSYTVPLFAN